MLREEKKTENIWKYGVVTKTKYTHKTQRTNENKEQAVI